MNLVDLRAGRQTRRLHERFHHLPLGQEEIHALAEELALRLQELLRAMGLEQGAVGDVEPELERLLGLGRCGTGADPLLVLGGEAPVGLHPRSGDHRLVGAGALLHREPELHDPRHAPLDGAEVGKAWTLGQAPDGLADLAAAHERQRHRIEKAPHRLAGDPARLAHAGHAAERAAEGQPRAPELGHGFGLSLGTVARHRRSQRAGELRLAVDPAPGQIGLLVIELAPALAHLVPGRKARHVARSYSTRTWRIALPSCRRSKPSLISSRRRVPLISRSTGSRPRL